MALRDNPFGEVRLPLVLSAAAALLVAIVAAAALLLSDRRETFQAEAYGVTRKAADAVTTPVNGALAAPIRWSDMAADGIGGYFFAVSENRRLKAELREAAQWKVAAIALRDTNDRYKALLGLKTDPPIPMVAGRTISDSRGPFANTRLINAGEERSVVVGNPVMSENGLVGRVIGVTKGASRILLLTDVASRTPVMIDRTNARAILTGDGGPNPKLEYLRGKDPVADGDQILTSGDGGVVPRGLPVGRAVKGLDGRWRVVLASDAAPIDYVRVLLFQDFRQLIDAKKLDEMTVPPPSAPVAGVDMVTTPAPAPALRPADQTAIPAAPAGGPTPKPVVPKPAVATAATTGPKPQTAPVTKPTTTGASKPPLPGLKPAAATTAKPAPSKPSTGVAAPKPTPPPTPSKPPAPKPTPTPQAEDPPH